MSKQLYCTIMFSDTVRGRVKAGGGVLMSFVTGNLSDIFPYTIYQQYKS